MSDVRSKVELRKYLDGQQSAGEDGATPYFEYYLAESSVLISSLSSLTELVVAKFKTKAAFINLTDGVDIHLLAGSWAQLESLGDHHHEQPLKWLGDIDTDLGTWTRLFRDSRHPDPEKQSYLVRDLTKHDRYKYLASVTGPPFLKFFAAVPIFSCRNIRIGSIIILDTASRDELPAQETSFLEQIAAKTMSHLEMSRQAVLKGRVMRLNEGINSFVRSQILGTGGLFEEPQSFKRHPARESGGTSSSNDTSSPDRALHHPHKIATEPEEHVNLALGPAARDSITSKGSGAALELGSDTGSFETPYRKVFRRAAEHLRTSLNVDGVVFVDGLVGFHGGLVPTSEPEQELELEIVQRPNRTQLLGEEREEEEELLASRSRTTSGHPGTKSGSVDEKDGKAYRTFTSADYQKNILTNRPAEVLGISVNKEENNPHFKTLSRTTKGLFALDEGFLQIFMEQHADGRVWYLEDNKGLVFYFENDVLIDSGPDGSQVFTAFPGAKQIIFAPLTDVTTMKRLAGCFAWTTRPFPVLSDVVDLVPYKVFLHSVEAEISRIDTQAALKQKESFVSSVSHDLRTPLHGVLGALDLLEDTSLDTFQRSLAHTIRFCGSTLHDTLGNLLSYARINEFERRSNQKRQKGAQESPWALLNKDEHTESGINSRGPFICTNLATLCEEIVEVTESGRTYGNSSETEDLVLVLNIDYREGWDFYTEPGAIRRILMNVVGNALKYSSRGSVRVCLKARDPPKEAKPLQEEEKGLGRQEVATKMVIFIVKDTGKGMSKDFVENHLFVPFSQENAGASEGVGLGMSIVKSLVALLGGQINVQTAVGSGTEMELTFPMKAGEPSAQDAPSTSKAMNPIVAELREKHLTVAVIRGLAPALYQALCNYLTDWFKATVVSEEELIRSDSVVDILIVRDSITSDIKTLRRMGRKHGRPALLIISATQKRCPESAINESFPVYEMVHTPLGPARLSKALLECLHKLESYSPTTEGSSPAISNESHTDVGAPELPEAVEAKDDQDLAFRGKDEAMSQFKHQRAETASPPLPTSTSGKDSRPAFSDVPPLNCSQPSLLLVDDNDINLKLLQMFAKKYGARDIEAVDGGMEAVEAVKRRTGGFDMIFMDLSMPEMDGFQATRAIRQLEREALFPGPAPSPRVVIVALTGLADAKSRDEAYKAGVDDFLTKPVNFRMIAELFEKWKQKRMGGGNQGVENEIE